MALIIEDGSIVDNATSYNTDAELAAYAEARGYTLPATEAERDILQIKAMDFINANESCMQGLRVSEDQEQAFPRNGVVVNGRLVASDKIPKTLKKAQNEASILVQDVALLTGTSVQNIQSEKLDVLATSYFKGGKRVKLDAGRIYNYLSPVLKPTNKLVRT